MLGGGELMHLFDGFPRHEHVALLQVFAGVGGFILNSVMACSGSCYFSLICNEG